MAASSSAGDMFQTLKPIPSLRPSYLVFSETSSF